MKRLILAAIAALLAFPGVASATDYTVTTATDHDDKLCTVKDCTLREAVQVAGSADSITLPARHYVLTLGELVLDADTIDGAGARTTSIDGGSKSRVLRITGDAGLSHIDGVTVTGGNGAGGGTSGQGGGIFVSAGSVVVMTDSTIAGNTGTVGGGVTSLGTFQLVGGTISGNVATNVRIAGAGGGVAVSSTGLLQLGNVTVSGNTATNNVGSGSGGGILTQGRAQIINVTIANNTASTGAALWQAAQPAAGGPTVSTLMSNTILTGTGAMCAGPGLAAPSAITSHNDIARDGSCLLSGAGDRQDVNPLIGALANNGGPTDTHALPPNSPAINTGSGCAELDQRGFDRPKDACDIGAYEYRAPTLTVAMAVVNDAGGPKGAGDFAVHVKTAAGDIKGSPQPGVATGRTYTLDPGTYQASADALAGYTRATTGDCDPKGVVTLAEGDVKACTITADDVAPRLTVTTSVVNDNGGTLTPAGVLAHVRTPAGSEASGSPQPGSGSGTTYTLVAGTYTVSGDARGYTITVSGDCAGNGTVALAVGDAKTCTITANDIAPTLRVITVVASGAAEPADFMTHVRAGTQDVTGSPQPGDPNGTLYTLSAGSYAVSAEGVTGYSAAASGDCAANGAIALQPGDNRLCTVTVEAGASSITVLTQVINDNGGTRNAADFALHVRAGATDVTGSPQAGNVAGTTYSIPADSYTVSAGAMPGYTTSSCVVDLGVGEDKSCTVTANDVAPKLTVITTVTNDNGGTQTPGGFSVHVRKGAADVAGSPKPGSAGGTTYTLAAGSYAVGADPVARYTTAVGGACAPSGAVTLAVGDVKTCTVKPNDNAVAAQQQLPPPVPHKNVNALPKTGTVKVKLPGTGEFVLLEEDAQIPLGTTVDVRRGRVTLVGAPGEGADFYGGIFKLGQTKGSKPITVLTLVEKLSCATKKKQASAAAKKKRKRRLWGDGKGRFRTKGKRSAATVVGTKWLVQDTCTTTLTRVVRGKVRVRDFVKKKTVIVKAGKKYVAKAR